MKSDGSQNNHRSFAPKTRVNSLGVTKEVQRLSPHYFSGAVVYNPFRILVYENLSGAVGATADIDMPPQINSAAAAIL